MENNITVNMENLTQDERDILLKLIKKANAESKVWKPKLRDDYWFINNRGVDYFNSNEDQIDDFLYSVGNCFKTKEEAEFALERQKVITELKRFAEENNEYELDWHNGKQNKYEIYYDASDEKIDVYWFYTNKRNLIYFSSEKIAREAIKTIGEDRLKKYYFEVED